MIEGAKKRVTDVEWEGRVLVIGEEEGEEGVECWFGGGEGWWWRSGVDTRVY